MSGRCIETLGQCGPDPVHVVVGHAERFPYRWWRVDQSIGHVWADSLQGLIVGNHHGRIADLGLVAGALRPGLYPGQVVAQRRLVDEVQHHPVTLGAAQFQHAGAPSGKPDLDVGRPVVQSGRPEGEPRSVEVDLLAGEQAAAGCDGLPDRLRWPLSL